MMRIGVDATCWANKRGFGRFTRELLEAILEEDAENEYVFFLDSGTEELDAIPAGVEKIVARTGAAQTRAAGADGRRSLGDLWAMSRAALSRPLDVFFFPASYSYFPIFNRTKIVVTLHDVIAERHPELIFPNAKARVFWRLKQAAAIRQADLIATVSEYSKRQIAEHFKLPDARLRLISEAARPVFRVIDDQNEIDETLARYGLRPDEEFLLYVGGISPHKNLGTLIDAFDRLAATRADLKLVLVGDYKDDPFFSAYPALKKQTEERRLTDRVRFTGFVPDEDLARLYNAARLLVFPSLEEGFGLPAIEAMACRCPVAASDCGSLPEVVGAAGRFFDPRDAAAMAAAIEAVLADDALRRRMQDAGHARAQEFRWQKAAHDTLRIFRELTGDV